ncbi:two-component system response regulator [Desulfonatronovibrio hydrogenovorans]|uniref:two-component system response regulator n=1 Tax=Desulfonatronovibrio hydrogenovorans TaxID=53245 RepID=UPI000491F49E|nr:EAL domain-containing response regulator [Desulfonatronovibrio hydrogenovorans]
MKSQILVVDDELINRSMLKRFLTPMADVQEAQDGFTALEKVSPETDLVLLDLVMEGMDGIEVCQKIKDNPATRDIPVIFISAVDDPKVKARGLEAGGVDFVSKPFDRSELLSRINTHLTMRAQALEIKNYTSDLENKVRERTRELMESEKRYRTIFEATKSAMVIVNSKSGLIGMVNNEFCDLSGYSRQEIQDKIHFSQFVHPDDLPRVSSYFEKRFTDPGSVPSEYELLGLTRNGSQKILFAKVATIPEWDSYVVSLFDLTDKRRVEEELRQRTFYSKLTGLPNSELLGNRLQKAIRTKHEDPNYFFAVIHVDLDRFKIINDSLGHKAGDQLIKMVAGRLEKSVRKKDTVAHIGGDDFVLLIEVSDLPEAALRAEKIKDQFTEPFIVDQNEIFATCSMGIVVGSTTYTEPEQIFRDADTALHRAKSTAPNSYIVFDPIMHAQVTELLTIETELRKAIARKEFILYYQPVVSLSDGRITGFEALIRWMHPEKGLVPPSVFIPIAEETELIIPMGEWVLNTACAQLSSWKKSGLDLKMNINLSGVQFRNMGLLNSLEEIFSKSQVDPSDINLELTESVVMDHAEKSIAALNRIKSLGVQLSVDDFGTGYSSLNYLQQLPIDYIKIDRSFTNMLSTDNGLALVKAILAMGHSLGLNVVAEGIENPQQMHSLRALNCNYAQGYYFSRPLPAREADSLVREHPFITELKHN